MSDISDRELLELIAAQVSKLTGMYSTVDTRLNGLESEISGLKQEITKTNLTIENKIMPKIDMLYEGQELLNQKIDNIKEEHDKKLDTLLMESTKHTSRLDKIEKAVVEHDEILFRRVK